MFVTLVHVEVKEGTETLVARDLPAGAALANELRLGLGVKAYVEVVEMSERDLRILLEVQQANIDAAGGM